MAQPYIDSAGNVVNPTDVSNWVYAAAQAASVPNAATQAALAAASAQIGSDGITGLVAGNIITP